jgi:hypothetical protein
MYLSSLVGLATLFVLIRLGLSVELCLVSVAVFYPGRRVELVSKAWRLTEMAFNWNVFAFSSLSENHTEIKQNRWDSSVIVSNMRTILLWFSNPKIFRGQLPVNSSACWLVFVHSSTDCFKIRVLRVRKATAILEGARERLHWTSFEPN